MTGFPELDSLLAEFVDGLRSALGANFTGAYMTGSFAIGDADVHSDVDWLVITQRALSEDETRALNALHAELFTRETHWAQHLEGSYAPRDELRRPGPEKWLFLDNGSTTLEWDAHCNTSVVRWTIRERPVVLAGPQPRELIDPVPADALRAEARPVLSEYAKWAHEPHAGHPSGMSRWKQPYVVLTLCRALHTIETATVCSKREAGEWAKRALDPEWRDLIQQAFDDRPDPWLRTKQDSTPELVTRTRAFADAVSAGAQVATSLSSPDDPLDLKPIRLWRVTAGMNSTFDVSAIHHDCPPALVEIRSHPRAESRLCVDLAGDITEPADEFGALT